MDLKSKQFKDLQATWYKKLKNSGFEDIEKDEKYLKFYPLEYFETHYDPIKYQAKEDYYRMAGKFLYDHFFNEAGNARKDRDQESRLIWQAHAEGTSIRNIVKLIKKKGFKSKRDKVHKIVQQLVKIMVENARK